MEKKWWHDKVAYQIYPKSFMDSNGDGIGDLQGIISRLDYLKDLGVDILWLSPIYKSPLADEGYDISDYYAIDPRFGSMQDMEELIAEAKKRGMTVLMDLVVNHCSDEHEWFKKACEDPDGQYGKYFYLRDKDPEGKLPTNWRSYFGGPCWDELPGTDKLYLHVFHRKQPDLNWENPQLREEVYKNIRWWMEKGIGGFRIDAIINIKKPAVFHDYPADRDDGLSSVDNMLMEAEGIGEFLGEMRDKAFAPYDAFTVGEVFNEKEGDLPLFIGENGYFSTMFDFSVELSARMRRLVTSASIPRSLRTTTSPEARAACSRTRSDATLPKKRWPRSISCAGAFPLSTRDRRSAWRTRRSAPCRNWMTSPPSIPTRWPEGQG